MAYAQPQALGGPARPEFPVPTRVEFTPICETTYRSVRKLLDKYPDRCYSSFQQEESKRSVADHLFGNFTSDVEKTNPIVPLKRIPVYTLYLRSMFGVVVLGEKPKSLWETEHAQREDIRVSMFNVAATTLALEGVSGATNSSKASMAIRNHSELKKLLVTKIAAWASAMLKNGSQYGVRNYDEALRKITELIAYSGNRSSSPTFLYYKVIASLKNSSNSSSSIHSSQELPLPEVVSFERTYSNNRKRPIEGRFDQYNRPYTLQRFLSNLPTPWHAQGLRWNPNQGKSTPIGRDQGSLLFHPRRVS